jgi:hypothetical protein
LTVPFHSPFGQVTAGRFPGRRTQITETASLGCLRLLQEEASTVPEAAYLQREKTDKPNRFVCLIGEKGKVLLMFFTEQ